MNHYPLLKTEPRRDRRTHTDGDCYCPADLGSVRLLFTHICLYMPISTLNNNAGGLELTYIFAVETTFLVHVDTLKRQ